MKSLQKELSKNTCATMVKIEYEEDRISNIYFLGGCHGLSSIIQRYIKKLNPTIKEAYDFLKGIICGRKGTSCANEIARVIKENLLLSIKRGLNYEWK